MLRQISAAVLGTIIAVSAYALSPTNVREVIALNDGSTLYVFTDGKMGMQETLGRASSMSPGHVMHATDGRTITMVGNEIARVDLTVNEPRD